MAMINNIIVVLANDILIELTLVLYQSLRSHKEVNIFPISHLHYYGPMNRYSFLNDELVIPV